MNEALLSSLWLTELSVAPSLTHSYAGAGAGAAPHQPVTVLSSLAETGPPLPGQGE